jgi:hypothetical protein
MSVNVITKPKVKSPQKFVRINIDPKLDKILIDLSREYPLFSNAEIIKMLLSKGIRQTQKNSFEDILSGQEFLNYKTEKEQFDFLKKNKLMK